MLALFAVISISSKNKKPSEGPKKASNKKEIKQEKEAIEGFDLSWYEKLKYDELRKLLRARDIKTYGKKHTMVKRLASVYMTELESMTVIQLRPKLKAKNFKQTGRKQDIIQKLVEAGI